MVRRPLGAPVDLRQSRRTRPFLCEMPYRVILFIQTGSRSRQGLPAPGTTPAPPGSGLCPRRRRSADARTTARPQAARPEPADRNGRISQAYCRPVYPKRRAGHREAVRAQGRPGPITQAWPLRGGPLSSTTRVHHAHERRLAPVPGALAPLMAPGCTTLPHKRMNPRNLPGGTAKMIDWRIAGRRPRRGINRLLA